jgi:hypothetical protein
LKGSPGKSTQPADPTIKARITELGGAVFASSATDYAKLIAEIDKWAKVIKFAGIKAE